MSVQPITTSPPGARDAGPSSPDGASAMLPDGASVVLRGPLSKRSTQHFMYQQRTFTLCAGADGVVHSLRYRSKDGGAVVIGAADITGVSVVDEAKHGFVVDVDAASAAIDHSLQLRAPSAAAMSEWVERISALVAQAPAPSARRLFAAADDAAAAADDAVTESSLPSEPPDGEGGAPAAAAATEAARAAERRAMAEAVRAAAEAAAAAASSA